MTRLAPSLARAISVLALSSSPGCGDDTAPVAEGSAGSTAATASPSTSTTDIADSSGGGTTAGTAAASSDGTTAALDSSGSDTTTGEPPWDGEPLPDAEVGQWQWVDIEDTECIDGSPTGLGVRYGSGDGLVIYFEGGGGCFDFASCSLFYTSFANFDEVAFDVLVPTLLSSGIFDDGNADNPVADWSFVYVPYCTGDVHAGDKDLGGVPGFAGAHQFVGYRNFGQFLQRIGPTFAEPSHVLVTGISAGGYGSSYNYDRIADAYAYTGSPITLLDDSGPPMSDAYLAPCMQEMWRELWGLDQTLPVDCTDCFDAGGWVADLTLYLRDKHADQWFGLLSSEQDATIRTFIGPSVNDCAGGIYLGQDYQDGLYELRDVILGGSPNFAAYYLPGFAHTYLPFPAYTIDEVQGVRIVDWVGDLLNGTATHVSP